MLLPSQASLTNLNEPIIQVQKTNTAVVKPESDFVTICDTIVKRHLGRTMDAKDRLISDSPERIKLENYIQSALQLVNTWSNSLLVELIFNPDNINNIWRDIRTNEHNQVAFISKVLTEIKLQYPTTNGKWEELIQLLSHAYGMDNDNFESGFSLLKQLDKEYYSCLVNKETVATYLRQNEWLIPLLGFTLMDFVE